MKPLANSPVLKCPNCGKVRTKVVVTRRDPNAVTVRRRECKFCEFRFYTKQELAPPEICIDGDSIKWMKDGEYEYVIFKTETPQDPKPK